MELKDLFNTFSTTPFLFIGSGITMRYLNLPNWKSLLTYFAKIIKNDDFSYSSYKQKAQRMDCPEGLMPKIAELIENDYNVKWYKDASIRTLNKEDLNRVKKGLSPFKAEIASYIRNKSKIVKKYNTEIAQLERLATKNISGVITTNYDTFIEDHFDGYKTYVGQSELIFSAIQGIAEIYKIHGSIEDPDSIVIDEKDYEAFNDRKAYLAAKLMTIFVEYPIIFMGYSLNDHNIKNIIEAIVKCLNQRQLSTLKNRFIFVDYEEDKKGVTVEPSNMLIDNLSLPMTRITLSDYSLLYDELETKKEKIPVRLLRRFKEALYEYVITNDPTNIIQVTSLNDKRIKDDDLALAIVRPSDLSLHGLSGISGDQWYRNIILNDLRFSEDDLLKYALHGLLSQNSGRLPVNKLIYYAEGDYPEAKKVSQHYTFNYIISRSIKKNRKYHKYTSIKEILQNAKGKIEKETELIAYLKEDQINVEELGSFLKTIFKNNKDILQSSSSRTRTNIRRLIMIYDFLKWGNKKSH